MALRKFELPGQEGIIHEGVFLRDESRNGTLVNKLPAFRPWQWLQDGDRIGAKDIPGQTGSAVDLFRVEYSKHKKLPENMVTLEVVSQSAPPESPARAPKKRPFGKGIVGKVVDVHYEDQEAPNTYRMRVIKYDQATAWHQVDSAGLSQWDGEDFDDTIDFNLMHSKGHIKFIDDATLEVKKEAVKTEGAQADTGRTEAAAVVKGTKRAKTAVDKADVKAEPAKGAKTAIDKAATKTGAAKGAKTAVVKADVKADVAKSEKTAVVKADAEADAAKAGIAKEEVSEPEAAEGSDSSNAKKRKTWSSV